MLNWAYFPRSAKPTDLTKQVVAAFEACHASFTSSEHMHASNIVLGHVAPYLIECGFIVEAGKKQSEKVHVPVLYGNNGKVAKSFDADAYHAAGRFVVEVEAGRGVINNQFLKDLFQACMMDNVDYLAIAVRNVYVAAGVRNQDFENVIRSFDTIYASNRLQLPLKGILVIGY
ncbi:MAG: hypothetical protein V4505_21765 [Pseudomonadota bacterium]